MSGRLLYMTRMLSVNGHGYFGGRELFDALEGRFDSALVGHYVMDPADEGEPIPPEFVRDAIRASTFEQFDPDVILMEEGLFADARGTWRIPQALLESAVESGAVLVVADVSERVAEENREAYASAAEFLGAAVDYGDEESPCYCADTTSFWKSHRNVICATDRIWVSDWLRPSFDGIDQIMVSSAVRLRGGTDVLATCNPDTAGVLQRDLWVRRPDPCPFAYVKTMQDGCVAFIAGGVTADALTREHPQNISWLVALVDLLRNEVRRDSDRHKYLRELQDLYEEALRQRRSPGSAPVEDAVAADVAIVLERDADDRSGDPKIRERLAAEFGEAWTDLDPRAAAALEQGDRLRSALEDYYSADPDADYALAVMAYSRALEIEVHRRLFEPFRSRSLRLALDSTGDPKLNETIRAFDAFADGSGMLGLGQMGHCLRELGCRQASLPGNTYAAFLEEATANGRRRFCDSGFAGKLQKYAQGYRNRAAHHEQLSLKDCQKARDRLLAEPQRLLVTLTELTVAPSSA